MPISVNKVRVTGISGSTIPVPTPTPTPTPSPPVEDPYFENVSLLLDNTTTNGQANGTFIDSSANAFTITATGNLYQGSTSPFFPAGYWSTYFDGDADYINTASIFDFTETDYSFECWVYATTLTSTNSGAPGILFIGDTTNNNGRIQVGITSTGAINFLQTNTAAVTNFDLSTTTGLVKLKTWYHIACVKYGANAYIYLDGVQVGTAAVSGALSVTSGVVNIGLRRASNLLHYWDGYISNFRIVRGSANVYTGNFAVPTTPLTAVSGTLLLTCQNNNFVDNSINNYPLTLNSTPSIARFDQFDPTSPFDMTTYSGSKYFDGSIDYLSVANNAAFNFGTGDFTVECWIYPTASDFGLIYESINSPATGGSGLFIAYNANNTITAGQALGATVVTSRAISLNSWYHVAVVRSGTSWNIFVNGQTRSTGTSAVSLNATGATTVGGNARNTTDTFNGYISNLRVVKGTALYAANTLATPPLTAVANTSVLTAQTNGLVDNSGNALTVTGFGNTVNNSYGPIGATSASPFGAVPDGYWANYFDGVGDYISVANNAAFNFGTGSFTVEGWIYPTTADFGVIYESVNSPASGAAGLFITFLANRTVSAGQSFGATIVTSSSALTLNTWYHIAVVRNGSAWTLYINGQSSATATNSVSLNATGATAIGGVARDTTFSFYGFISNLRVVKDSAVYTGNFTPSTSPLTAISGTSLLTCQSSTFKDNSANNFTVTASGNTFTSVFTPLASPNGGSLYFDGTGDYATVANNAILNMGSSDFTIECWFHPVVTPNGNLFGKRASGTVFSGISVGFVNSLAPRVIASFNGTSWGLDMTSTVSCGLAQWNHIAIVRNGSTWALFVNGSQGATTTLSGTINTNSDAFSIGANGANGANTITQSYISNLRVVKGTAIYYNNIVPPTSPLTAIANTSLLLKFENAGIYDASSNVQFSTEGNAQVSTTRSKFGTTSVYLDGTGDYLMLNNLPSGLQELGPADFTIECWINLESINPSANSIVFDFRPGATQGAYPLLYINSSGKMLYYVSSADRITSTSTLSTNVWYHVALTRSGTSTKLFINGVQEGSTYTDSTSYIGVFNRPVIGASGATLGATPLTGYIDGLRITGGVARYTSNFSVPTEPFPTY